MPIGHVSRVGAHSVLNLQIFFELHGKFNVIFFLIFLFALLCSFIHLYAHVSSLLLQVAAR